MSRGVALPYDTLFLGGEKSGMKAILLYRGINIKMDSTMMLYDQQHKEGAQTKTLAAHGLEELFSSCAVVSVFGSGGK